MKRFLITTLTTVLLCTVALAQNANYQKAVAKYKSFTSLTATATKTKHKTSVAKDVVSQGRFYVKKPNKVLITFNQGKDALLMNGTNFTMTIGGRKFKTNSTKNAQFKTFQNVLESIYTGGSIDLSKNKDVDIAAKGNEITITITPTLDQTDAKRQMFTSFVLTIDSKTSELRTLRMNEKKGNYTEYRFSAYQFGTNVPDEMFK